MKYFLVDGVVTAANFAYRKRIMNLFKNPK